jgi:hypothetical protein
MSAITQAASLADSIPEDETNFRALRELKNLLKDDVAARAAHMIRKGLGDGRLDLTTVLHLLEGDHR